jgi:hypothetical protein
MRSAPPRAALRPAAAALTWCLRALSSLPALTCVELRECKQVLGTENVFLTEASAIEHVRTFLAPGDVDGDDHSEGEGTSVMLRARWVTLRAHWVTLRARWVTLRARWVTLRARWVMLC